MYVWYVMFKNTCDCYLTCTILEIIMGNILRGNRSMLNRDKDTNAFFASSTLASSTSTYVANETSDT